MSSTAKTTSTHPSAAAPMKVVQSGEVLQSRQGQQQHTTPASKRAPTRHLAPSQGRINFIYLLTVWGSDCWEGLSYTLPAFPKSRRLRPFRDRDRGQRMGMLLVTNTIHKFNCIHQNRLFKPLPHEQLYNSGP
jgi:hypothetical protein